MRRFSSQEEFYKSKEWTGLLVVMRNDRSRMNGDGEIICEYCGKPIVKAYDCIGHHKIYLTEENINDVEISLNPENIALVHHRCHNKIHNKLGYHGQRVYVVWGSPMSGKSSWVQLSKSPGDLIIDIDSIWQCVSGCSRYEKPARLNSVIFGVRDTLIDMVKFRRGKWQNAYIIGGYPFQGERERLCNALGAESIFIDTPKEECINRLLNEEDGRNQAELMEYIDLWWKRYTPTLTIE